jgi:predicted 3-demethylubiquinone-9 3-methyltransferase (glyoxalase superfamily)
MDSGKVSPLTFKQAISFVLNCDTQKEIDYYWEKLTEEGEEIQCGWLNDKFGFPWQVVPVAMEKMMAQGSKEQIARVTEAFMKMKKFDIETLERAFNG